MGNSIVSGLSTKSNQPGQLSPQTQRELEQAEKSGQVSAELARKVVEETSRGLSVGLKGSTLKVTDGKTDWGGDLNEMTNYGDLMLARRSLLSEFDMSSDSGRALDMGFMQMQAAQMRQMTQTPIEESAAYLQGMARGEARYNQINRDRISQQQRQVQTTRQLDTLNKQTWQADQARAKMTTLEKVQLGFDIAGMTEIPGVSQLAELGSAGISAYNGDYVGAGLGVASMIPIVGKWAEVAKMEHRATIVQRSNDRIKTYTDTVSTGVIQRGGAHGDVRGIPGYESHHMPADSISPIPTNRGPAVAMEIDDHRMTASWGNSREARAYRKEQSLLIEQGKFRNAQQMDIEDIQVKFGMKYDEAIEQMLAYTKKKGY